MSTTNGVNGVMQVPGTATNSTDTSQTLGKDDFLKIFAAQLQNQDPSNTNSDPTAYVQQMAQFSMIEQLTNLAQAQGQAVHGANVNLVGHTVDYVADDGSVGSGVVQSVAFDQTDDNQGDTLTINGVTGIKVSSVLDVK